MRPHRRAVPTAPASPAPTHACTDSRRPRSQHRNHREADDSPQHPVVSDALTSLGLGESELPTRGLAVGCLAPSSPLHVLVGGRPVGPGRVTVRACRRPPWRRVAGSRMLHRRHAREPGPAAARSVGPSAGAGGRAAARPRVRHAAVGLGGRRRHPGRQSPVGCPVAVAGGSVGVGTALVRITQLLSVTAAARKTYGRWALRSYTQSWEGWCLTHAPAFRGQHHSGLTITIIPNSIGI